MNIKLKGSFFKSIVILASGSVVAQLITVITSPILTRLFSADELGGYTYLLSVASIFMAVINGRYDMSIVSEKNEENVYPLIKVSLLIGVIASLIVTVGYYYINFFDKSSNDRINNVVFLFLLLISYAINNVVSAYNNRNREYKIITSVYVVRTTFQNIGGVIAGIFKWGSTGLMFSYTLGQFMGINKQIQSLKPHFKDIMKCRINEMKDVARIHYKQPLYSAPAIFINSFSYSSITLFLESLFGMASVGYYSISVRLLGLPLALISGNISKVFFEEASKEYHETNQFINSFKKTFKFQLILAIPMVIFMIILAPKMCTLVFGPEWNEAGRYVAILAPMFGLKFIVTALSPGLIIANKQRLELILQSIFIFSSIICFIAIKLLRASIEYYLLGISILFSLSYFIYLIAIFRNSKKK